MNGRAERDDRPSGHRLGVTIVGSTGSARAHEAVALDDRARVVVALARPADQPTTNPNLTS